VSEAFPFKWINKKWKEGFHVTSMTTAGSRWGVVMSRNSGFSDQVSVSLNLFIEAVLVVKKCWKCGHWQLRMGKYFYSPVLKIFFFFLMVPHGTFYLLMQGCGA